MFGTVQAVIIRGVCPFQVCLDRTYLISVAVRWKYHKAFFHLYINVPDIVRLY